MAKKKTKLLTVRVSEETFDQAQQVAQGRGSTISKIIQSFLHLFANQETPPGWPPDLPEATGRAPETKPRRPKTKK